MLQTKQIIFNVGNEQYGIDILKVHEIDNTGNFVRIPNAPECILGIMNLRGEVIPIYSLRKRFNITQPAVNNETQQLIITAVDDMKIGFLVDSVNQIQEIRQDQLYSTPKIVLNSDTDFIANVACVDKQIILLLDVSALIKDGEREQISALLDEVNDK